jgi:aldehyde:ferredoxin oxidoreductase
MKILTRRPAEEPHLVLYRRCTVDLRTGAARLEDVPCRNLEDVLGGFGRSFQQLAEREICTAYCEENPLIVNTGLLTGTAAMTGLRTYFSGYSPLKGSRNGLPAAMWSAASGNFGPRFAATGLDELVLEGRSPRPVYVVVREGADGPAVELRAADPLRGLSTHAKIMALHRAHPGAHFAAIGQAGEHWETNYMGAVAISTDLQLRNDEDKCRFAGRGGMGSLMGYKNVLALVAESEDRARPVSAAVKQVNLDVVKGGGSARLQPRKRGGGGGTWGNYDVLQVFHAVPVNNFRPQGNDLPERLFRASVDLTHDVKEEACHRCGITCHNNVYERKADGTRGEFLAKFDYEPLNLLGTNLGLHDPGQAARLIQLGDNYGMDSITLGVTISYVLAYNARHPERPLLNGATFGEYEKIRALVVDAGEGRLPEVGRGSMRLSASTGETSYAYHVKGLELPAYQPETNPGYAWAIAGGHMSMATYGLLTREGKSDLDSWVKGITQDKLAIVGFDMVGLCKFFDIAKGIATQKVVDCLRSERGIEVEAPQLAAAVRRAFLRGLALERRQGYTKEEYALPAEVFERPNAQLKLPATVATPEFFAELSRRVWEVFDAELEGLLPERGAAGARPAC